MLAALVLAATASGCTSNTDKGLPPPGQGPTGSSRSTQPDLTTQRACQAADVKVVVATTGGFTAGMYFATMRASLRPQEPCVLQGWAAVTLLDTNHRSVATRLVHKGRSHAAVVSADEPAEWDLLWSQVPGSSPCPSLTTIGTIKISWPGGVSTNIDATPQSANNSGPPKLCAGGPSTLTESAFGTHAF